MNGIHVTVSNPPIPAKPEFCTMQGCKYHANKLWYGGRWLCSWHFYRAYRAIEMNDDSPEAA